MGGMRTALSIAAVMSVASSAAAGQSPVEEVHAFQPARYLQAGLMAGAAAPVAGLNVMGAVEAGKRLADSAAWLHVAVAYGVGGDDQGPGSNFQWRVGIEGRTCAWEGRFCGVGGLDVGYQAGRWSDRDDPSRRESVDALVTVPRLGVDVGGAKVRVRLALEADYGLVTQREPSSSSGAGSRSPGLVGVELGLGVGYQW
jgi:hypothetical protein